MKKIFLTTSLVCLFLCNFSVMAMDVPKIITYDDAYFDCMMTKISIAEELDDLEPIFDEHCLLCEALNEHRFAIKLTMEKVVVGYLLIVKRLMPKKHGDFSSSSVAKKHGSKH